MIIRENEFERIPILYKEEVISKSSFEQAEASYKSALEQVNASQKNSLNRQKKHSIMPEPCLYCFYK
jgi:multidrug resistance efflux pump